MGAGHLQQSRPEASFRVQSVVAGRRQLCSRHGSEYFDNCYVRVGELKRNDVLLQSTSLVDRVKNPFVLFHVVPLKGGLNF